MRIFRKVVFNADQPEVDAYQSAGIHVAAGYGSFVIAESDPRWPQVSKICGPAMSFTSFSAKELQKAPHLVMIGDWLWSYPEPRAEFRFFNTTYDTSDFCWACGRDKRQNAPFKISSAPAWGRRDVFQLNWIFDEFFVTPRAYT